MCRDNRRFRMSIGEMLRIVTNIEVIHDTHIATQTYGVYIQ